MEDAGDDAANAVILPLDRVGVNQTASIFPLGVTDRVMRGEGFAGRQERFPPVAHQMRRHVNMFAQNPARLALGEISHDPGPGVAGGCTFLGCRRRSYHAENWCLGGSELAFASPSQAWLIGILARAAADVALPFERF